MVWICNRNWKFFIFIESNFIQQKIVIRCRHEYSNFDCNVGSAQSLSPYVHKWFWCWFLVFFFLKREQFLFGIFIFIIITARFALSSIYFQIGVVCSSALILHQFLLYITFLRGETHFTFCWERFLWDG